MVRGPTLKEGSRFGGCSRREKCAPSNKLTVSGLEDARRKEPPRIWEGGGYNEKDTTTPRLAAALIDVFLLFLVKSGRDPPAVVQKNSLTCWCPRNTLRGYYNPTFGAVYPCLSTFSEIYPQFPTLSPKMTFD